MSLREFELIRQYFKPLEVDAATRIGIGDDAAVLSVKSQHELIVSVDTLVEGIHFPASTTAFDIGYKSLAVNLSDMAAMGAIPRWFTLSVTIPKVDESWISDFAAGLRSMADPFQISLIGGDTTKGPLCISIQIMGEVSEGASILRSGAAAGEDIYVSGSLGEAALGLLLLGSEYSISKEDRDYCLSRLYRPEPRVAAGSALKGIASAMIDCSDGLVADLGHILQQSQVGGEIYLDQMPISAAMVRWIQAQDDWSLVLSGGDDYELIFTAAKVHRQAIADLAVEQALALTRIGSTITEKHLHVFDQQGQQVSLNHAGFQHF